MSRWDELVQERKRPRRIDYLGIPGSIEGGTTTFLAISTDNKPPLFAVKIHRNANEHERVKNEAAVLREIHARGGDVASSVPKVIFCEEMDGLSAIVQSILKGSPMTSPMTANGMPKHHQAASNMSAVSRWLGSLFQTTYSECQGTLTPSRLPEFMECFPLTSEERQFAKHLSDEILHLKTVRTGIQHGDYCRQNILCSTQFHSIHLNVIDWTDSRLNGVPLFDFFFFITSYCLQVRKKVGIDGFLETFHTTFFERNPYQEIVCEQVRKHCDLLGIGREEISTLFGWFLVEQAMFEYNKLLKFARNGEFPRFTLYLAASQGKGYEEAAKEQLWIYFFKYFVKNRRCFLVSA